MLWVVLECFGLVVGIVVGSVNLPSEPEPACLWVLWVMIKGYIAKDCILYIVSARML